MSEIECERECVWVKESASESSRERDRGVWERERVWECERERGGVWARNRERERAIERVSVRESEIYIVWGR